MLGFNLDVFTKALWVVITPVALLGIFIYSMVVFKLPTFNGMAYPDIAYSTSLSYIPATHTVPLAAVKGLMQETLPCRRLLT